MEEEFKNTIKKLDNKNSKASAGAATGLQIDESLFNAEDLPDLDEELEKLEI